MGADLFYELELLKYRWGVRQKLVSGRLISEYYRSSYI